jgi:hypothetical protein
MSTTSALSPSELKSLIQSAVDEAFEARLSNMQSDWDDDMTDAALASAMEEAKGSSRMSPEEFFKRLESNS